jgi:phosphatidylglycerol---prolipoprotein diacylglyceryl transferase
METLTFLGREIPVYGLMGVSGMCLAMAYALFSCRKFGLDRDDTAYIFVLGALGSAAGAKVLYLIVSADEIAVDIMSDEMSMLMIVNRHISGGMVFYGGLLGALAAAWYTARRYGKDAADFFPVLIPGFALAHGIARIGCLLTGCCYGIEADLPISITYHSSYTAPNGVPLLPVQAMEAAAEILIFIVLIIVSNHMRNPAEGSSSAENSKIEKNSRTAENCGTVTDRITVLWIYFFMYAPLRFCLEFLRGDEARGSFLMFSTSQWLSIVLAAAAAVQLYIHRHRGIRKCRDKETAGR